MRYYDTSARAVHEGSKNSEIIIRNRCENRRSRSRFANPASAKRPTQNQWRMQLKTVMLNAAGRVLKCRKRFAWVHNRTGEKKKCMEGKRIRREPRHNPEIADR